MELNDSIYWLVDVLCQFANIQCECYARKFIEKKKLTKSLQLSGEFAIL